MGVAYLPSEKEERKGLFVSEKGEKKRLRFFSFF